jgi:predicted site-specific integrase-resolvase
MMTVTQAAIKFRVTPRTIQRWIQSGYFPNARRKGLSPNSPWTIPNRDIDAVVLRLQQISPQSPS